jgi:hypothetical protein
MARADIKSLLTNYTPEPEPPAPSTPAAAPEAPPADETNGESPERNAQDAPSGRRGGKSTRARSTKTKSKQTKVDGDLPKYLALTRKDVTFREDQLNDLTAMSRRINKARNRQGERITENTLVRVAVDLLLTNHPDLLGLTEEDLREAAGL